jgi:hypothetical protein
MPHPERWLRQDALMRGIPGRIEAVRHVIHAMCARQFGGLRYRLDAAELDDAGLADIQCSASQRRLQLMQTGDILAQSREASLASIWSRSTTRSAWLASPSLIAAPLVQQGPDHERCPDMMKGKTGTTPTVRPRPRRRPGPKQHLELGVTSLRQIARVLTERPRAEGGGRGSNLRKRVMK